ncbi:type II toxin-antitoxin system VapC family toxin [Endozoicomonas sp. SM1973]|uniref:Type II toxin-antitoxin system VapC family toxin n=1 Tax=Spartinivicinus marinus TaxID=2994442 RepID=A0A853IHZ8_9GAMM|nr:type II toxin-antitoxin system VapC family toxin [Spartinivicinus marinus]
MYLLDTNVISQLMRLNPNPNVLSFFKEAKKKKQPIYLSAITIGEIRKGITKLTRRKDIKQAEYLKQKLTTIMRDYAGLILPIDEDVSEAWGVILGNTDDTNAIDKLIAATAAVYNLTVVTRNIQDIEPTGVKCLNPFEEVKKYGNKQH